MNFNKSAENWESLAQTDPLWAICTDPDKKGNRWDADDFFSTGVHELEIVFKYLFEKHYLPEHREKALDFGCGAGRLTRALTNYFSEVVGVDVSATMIQKALQYNQEFSDRISFIHNPYSDLKTFKSDQFSFIYTTIVLQHIPPDNAKSYISEFLRLLKPGGVLVFQIPTADQRKLSLLKKLRSFLKIKARLSKLGIIKSYHMDMYYIEDKEIISLLSAPFIELLDIVESNHTEPDFNGNLILGNQPEGNPPFLSKLFIVKKKI